MTRIYSYTAEMDANVLDAYCVLQKEFTDQFVYYDKAHLVRYLGLGRCIALPTLDDAQTEREGAVDQAPVFFSFNRFDAGNPAPADALFQAFPFVKLMLPEVVLIENEQGVFLQLNSLGPVYGGRVDRFMRQAVQAPKHKNGAIAYSLELDSLEEWRGSVKKALGSIKTGKVDKLVLSRRVRLEAHRSFSARDLLINLIDGSACGTVLLYRYADVFFCGCTPELLIRKRGSSVESMCLAGTCASSAVADERKALARALLHDAKNRTEHAYVADFIRMVFNRCCYDVEVPDTPGILSLAHVQHLCTPAIARVLQGVDLITMKDNLHPTPAVAGYPVGEAMMLLRSIEHYNRGLYAGVCGFVDGSGDGEFSVALRSGVFDGEGGWLYAGCGIVDGSEADDEYHEIEMKLKTILSAFEGGKLQQ